MNASLTKLQVNPTTPCNTMTLVLTIFTSRCRLTSPRAASRLGQTLATIDQMIKISNNKSGFAQNKMNFH